MDRYNLRRAPALLCYYRGKLAGAEALSLPTQLPPNKTKFLVVQASPDLQRRLERNLKVANLSWSVPTPRACVCGVRGGGRGPWSSSADAGVGCGVWGVGCAGTWRWTRAT